MNRRIAEKTAKRFRQHGAAANRRMARAFAPLATDRQLRDVLGLPHRTQQAPIAARTSIRPPRSPHPLAHALLIRAACYLRGDARLALFVDIAEYNAAVTIRRDLARGDLDAFTQRIFSALAVLAERA